LLISFYLIDESDPDLRVLLWSRFVFTIFENAFASGYCGMVVHDSLLLSNYHMRNADGNRRKAVDLKSYSAFP